MKTIPTPTNAPEEHISRRDFDKEMADCAASIRATVNRCPLEWRHHLLTRYARAAGKLAVLHSRQLRHEAAWHIALCNRRYSHFIRPEHHGWDRPLIVREPRRRGKQ